MVIELEEKDIESIQKHFGNPKKLNVYNIVVNNEKHALLFCNCTIGELFSSKNIGELKPLLIEVESEKEFNVKRTISST